MMHRSSHGRGTLLLEREWHGVRIYRASGTNDPVVYAAIDQALSQLKRSDDVGLSTRLAIWGELAAGDLRPLAFLEQVRRFGLAGLRPGETAQDLRKAIARWLAGGPATRKGRALSPSTIESYRLHLEHHVLGGAPVGAGVDELPGLVRRVRDEATPATATVVRTAALAFARWAQGKHSDLWRAIADVSPRALPDHDRRGLELQEAREKAEQLGTEGLVWWTLCLTGMRVKREYLSQAWMVHPGKGIEIGASKTPAGRRWIPLITEPVRSVYRYTALAKRLRAVGVTAHIARYTYKHLLGEAGIPPDRIELYLGHSLGGLKVYGRHDVKPHLVPDAQKLRAFIGQPPQLLQAVP